MYFQPRISVQTMIKSLKIVHSSTVKVLCSTSFHDFSQIHIEWNLHGRYLHRIYAWLLISMNMVSRMKESKSFDDAHLSRTKIKGKKMSRTNGQCRGLSMTIRKVGRCVTTFLDGRFWR